MTSTESVKTSDDFKLNENFNNMLMELINKIKYIYLIHTFKNKSSNTIIKA